MVNNCRVKVHIARVHEKKKTHACDTCDMCFGKKRSLIDLDPCARCYLSKPPHLPRAYLVTI